MRSGRNTLLGPSTFLNVIVFGGDLIVFHGFGMCYAKTYPALIKWSSCVLSVAHVYLEVPESANSPSPRGLSGGGFTLKLHVAIMSNPLHTIVPLPTKRSHGNCILVVGVLKHLMGIICPYLAMMLFGSGTPPQMWLVDMTPHRCLISTNNDSAQ